MERVVEVVEWLFNTAPTRNKRIFWDLSGKWCLAS